MNVGIFGFGTVGSGVARILLERTGHIKARNSTPLQLAKICTRNLSSTDTKNIPKELFTETKEDILENNTIDTVVEVIGGTTAAKEIVSTALQNKKNVVTANKALMSEHGEELLHLAHNNNVQLLFEASVAGGIPIIRVLREYYTAGNISKISGILNGTCNYLLSELEKGGKKYDEVCTEAQKLGFAEADPTFDVEGFDAAQKLSLLVALAFGTHIPDWKNIPRTGISHLLPSDFEFAKKIGCRIRLIARAEKTSAGIQFGVHPRLIPKNSRLGSITGPDNGIHIEEEFLGPISLIGAGAGSLPTATAIVSDLGELQRYSSSQHEYPPAMGFYTRNICTLAPRESIEKKTYFRIHIQDSVGVMARITEIFAEENISIQEVQNGNNNLPLAFLLHPAPITSIEKAAEKIQSLSFVTSAPVVLPVEDE